MALVLTPTPPVVFCIQRLRGSVAEASRFSDEDLRAYINEGYRSACERALALQSVSVVTFPVGATEAALPLDWATTIRAYQAGLPLDPIPYRHSAAALPGTYYQYEGVIGISVGDPDQDVAVTLLYARTPILLDYADAPEWGPEWNYMLRHYAAWRCILASGGAQSIGKAVRERTLYEQAVRGLRHQNRVGAAAQARRMRSVVETRWTPVAG